MNLYVHFPFCRSKCAYCALHSRAGSSVAERREYVARIACDLDRLFAATPDKTIATLYFGGGTPALCNLQPILNRLAPHLSRTAEGGVMGRRYPEDTQARSDIRLGDGGYFLFS